MTIEEVYDAYIDTVYKFFYINCFDRSVAEDLTSQTFLSYAERFEAGALIGDSKKFIYGIMRNVWAGYLRERYRRAETSLEDIGAFEQSIEKSVADYSGATLRERALPYIERLPEQQRRVVLMRLIHEVSIKDISSEIGKDSNYVKTTYKRGVKNLRNMLAQTAELKEVL